MMDAAADRDGDRLDRAQRILRAAAGDRVRARFPMALMTSFRIGGPAALFLEAETYGDLGAIAEAVTATGVPWFVIGKGSNLLVSDGGFPGLVVRLGKGFRWAARDGVRLAAGGSMPLPGLAGVALSHGLAGLEFGVAIPATLGGSVRMNAGAHGHAMDEVLERVELFSLRESARASIDAREGGFSYRTSVLPEDTVVVGATMLLRPGSTGEIRAGMEEAREWRRATQPLAEPNCGSVFKNPPGDQAARLAEAAGAKGLSVGGARVSEKHANFIVARPGTRAREVLQLMHLVQDRVRDRFGVELEQEVKLVGHFDLAPL